MACVAAAQEGALSGVSADFQPLAEAYRDELFRVLEEREHKPNIPAPELIRGSSHSREIFLGSKVETDTSVGIKLKLARAQAEPFEIWIAFDNGKALLRSSRPRSRKYSGGITMTFSKKERREFFLDGADDTGVVVYFPPSSAWLESVILCPRTFAVDRLEPTKDEARWGKRATETKLLRDSKYTVAALNPEVDASVSGTATFGYEGTVTVKIETNPRIAPADPNVDSESSTKAYAEISYGARPDWEPSQAGIEWEKLKALEGDNLFIAGIRGVVEMLGPAGHKRQSAGHTVVTVERARLIERAFDLNTKGSVIPVQPGQCALVAKETLRIDTYSDPG